MCEISIKVHIFPCAYVIVLATFVEKNFLSRWIILVTLLKNICPFYAFLFHWSVVYPHTSLSQVISGKILKSGYVRPSILFFFQNCFGYFIFFVYTYIQITNICILESNIWVCVRISLSIFTKSLWDSWMQLCCIYRLIYGEWAS